MSARVPGSRSTAVSMADIDAVPTPPRASPHRPASAITLYELEVPFSSSPPTAARTGATPAASPALEDVISSLDTSADNTRVTKGVPSKVTQRPEHVPAAPPPPQRVSSSPPAHSTTTTNPTTSPSSSSAPSPDQSPPQVPSRRDRHRQREHVDGVPSAAALYAHRRAPAPHQRDAAQADPLIERMEEKEKLFDEKVKEIDRTFYRVGHQLVVRDDMIERLQRELAHLRREVNSATATSAANAQISGSSPPLPAAVAARHQDWHQREQVMLDQLSALAQSLKEEREAVRQTRESAVGETVQQLRAALEVKQREVVQQEAHIASLRSERQAARQEVQAQKKAFRQQIEALREAHQKDLVQLETHFHQLENRCGQAEQACRDWERSDSATQAQLLALRLSTENDRERDDVRQRVLHEDCTRLQEELDAVHMSMARLLRVMEQVPILRDYLRWNELEHEFVFLGYPTRYFGVAGNAHPEDADDVAAQEDGVPQPRGRRTESPSYFQRSTSTPQRTRSRSHRSSWQASQRGLADSPSSFLEAGGRGRQTGVDDGVYSGTASAQDTKNVWLNGNWVSSLQSIIQAENQYLRLKRIKLHELEEAAQLSEQLPSARDVLECRQQERDYWVPYAVFEEAQRFKNKFCPRLPALSHFFPFLMKLNRVWNARLQERVRVLKKQLTASQRQLQHANRKHTRLTGSRCGVNDTRDVLGRSVSFDADVSTSRRGIGEIVHPRGHASSSSASAYALQKALTSLEEEHYRLRRDVRLNVVSQATLQFFHMYDVLVRQTLSCAREAAAVGVASGTASSGQRGREGVTHAADVFWQLRDRHPVQSVDNHQAERWASYDLSADSNDDDEQQEQEKEENRYAPPQPTASRELDVLRERVAAVGDHLLAQILACSQDLLELMSALRARLAGRDGSTGPTAKTSEGVSFTSSLWASTAPDAATRSDEASTLTNPTSPSHTLHRDIRDLLRVQYGGGEGGYTRARSRTATPTRDTRHRPAEDSGQRASGDGAPRLDQALPCVMETALDYSNEVRQLVLEAYEALQRIVHDRALVY